MEEYDIYYAKGLVVRGIIETFEEAIIRLDLTLEEVREILEGCEN